MITPDFGRGSGPRVAFNLRLGEQGIDQAAFAGADLSKYGDVNAVTRADVRVEKGKLTEVVMNHRAAEVTFVEDLM